MNNNLKIFALIFLSFFLFASVVSAFGKLDFSGVSFPTTVLPNNLVTISFNLTDSGDIPYNSLNWSDSTISSQGVWQNLPSLTAIAVGETKLGSATFQVQPYTSGIININLVAKNGSIVSKIMPSTSYPISITINNTFGISLTQTPITRTQNGQLTITNNGNTVLNSVQFSSSGDFGLSVYPVSGTVSISPRESKVFSVANNTDLSSLKFGSSSALLNITSGTFSTSTSFSFDKTFCKNGQVGNNLSIDGVTIRSSGDDDTIWKPLEDITIKVDVDNDGSDSISSVYVELGIFDSSGKNVVRDLDFKNADNEKIKLGSINDGSGKTATFEFKVPADFNDAGYRLAVKTYSKESGVGEDQVCADRSTDLNNNFYQTISVEKQDDIGKFIAFDKTTLSPADVFCGDRVLLNFDVVNVGNEDQDRVKVLLKNSELGLNMFDEITNGLNQGEGQALSFIFTVPEGVANKTYTLTLNSQYDYNDGDYDETSDESTNVLLRVSCTGAGNNVVGSKVISILTSSSNEVKAGETLNVVAKITNFGTSSASFVVGSEGYQSWATISSISENVFSLGAGASKDVTFVLNAKNDSSGAKTFTIRVNSGSNSESKDVSVNVLSSSSQNGLFSYLGNNYLLWVVAAVNIILIVLIIIVAIRVSRK